MPLEGHWARQNSSFVPTDRRELRVVVIGGVLAAVLTVAVVVTLLLGSARTAEPGCHYTTVASTTGGATVKVCDSKTTR